MTKPKRAPAGSCRPCGGSGRPPVIHARYGYTTCPHCGGSGRKETA